MKDSILSQIGNTPIIEFIPNGKNRVFAKLEYFNPFGSIKDRAAYQIITDATKNGTVHHKKDIVEATSGNMGIALSAISNIIGLSCTIIMPENMSESRKRIIKAYGAKLILTPQEKGIIGAIELAKSIAEESDAFYVDQFNNPSSIIAHLEGTAPEIYNHMGQNCDIIILGVGSGGTISGIGQYFKTKSPNTQIIGVLPSIYPHKIQGIGAGFTPKILNKSVIDTIITVSDQEAFAGQNELVRAHGIFAGISSGAVFSAYKKLETNSNLLNKRILLIFPDSGERYI